MQLLLTMSRCWTWSWFQVFKNGPVCWFWLPVSLWSFGEVSEQGWSFTDPSAILFFSPLPAGTGCRRPAWPWTAAWRTSPWSTTAPRSTLRPSRSKPDRVAQIQFHPFLLPDKGGGINLVNIPAVLEFSSFFFVVVVVFTSKSRPIFIFFSVLKTGNAW